MLQLTGLSIAVLFLAVVGVARAEDAAAKEESASKDARCYELRVYCANDGKLDALNQRFRDHTCKLFEKHGMTNVGYWMPLENPDRKLYYILSYPSRADRDTSWAAFTADPEWKAAAAASEKDGKLVAKVESSFLQATDYSPPVKIEKADQQRTFELRTYTTTPGNLPRLHERFRDHTIALFSKHGMSHIGYWTLASGQPAAGDTLVYMLAHKSKAACDESFKSFRGDPVWIEAKAASEKAAGGSLTVPDGVKSVLLTPTDYSPLK